MECRKLPVLKFGHIFVPHKTFEIVFSHESYIQTKTYQSFEYSQVPNTTYAVDLHRATHISAGNQTTCLVQF